MATTAGAAQDIPLIDHHCHGVVRGDLDLAGLERFISESPRPPAAATSTFDAPLGLAIRRWCAPVLDLDTFPSPEGYAARRLALGAHEVDRRLIAEGKLAELLLDTGFRSSEVVGPGEMRTRSGVPVREIVRIEAVSEDVAVSGVDASDYPDAFERALEEASREAAGLKTIVAYRGGFAFDPAPPDPADVVAAAGPFVGSAAGGSARVEDPVLLRFGIWTGARLARERGFPMQFHVGWGDPDLELHLTNPTLLTRLIRGFAEMNVDVALLHCYPFHRDAGYLAAMYPNVYFDVGSAMHYLGASSQRLLAEAMEVAPFGKLLFSTDAFGVAEQYHLGAMLFRRALGRILDAWIAADDCDAATAERIALAVGAGNARRIYPTG